MRIREREKQTLSSILGIIVCFVIGAFLIVKTIFPIKDSLPGTKHIILMFIATGIMLIGPIAFSLHELTTETKYQERVRKEQNKKVQELKKRNKLK